MDKETLQKTIADLPQTDDKTDPNILSARKTHKRSHIIWTSQEDAVLQQLHLQKKFSSTIARLLKRSEGAIEARIKVLKFGPELKKENVVVSKEKFIDSKQNIVPVDNKKLSEAHQILRYWRNSLADADKMGLSFKEMAQSESFPFESIQAGQLPQEKIKRFFDEAEKRAREKANNPYKKKSSRVEEESFIKQLPVLVAPYVAMKNYEHGQEAKESRGPAGVFPLWILASLDRNGRLTPTEEVVCPWIGRRCLTPNGDNKSSLAHPTMGDIADVDHFYAKHAASLEDFPRTWEKLFLFANDLFRSLGAEPKAVFEEQHYSLLNTGSVLPTHDMSEPSQNIIKTYDQYLFSDKKIPDILERFCSLKDKAMLSDYSPETLFMASTQHYGQMQDAHPLSASQRLSMSYFSDPEHNNIFTIHGPPGTGKTTLLQSVIASKWIEAAIHKKPPPIQVAASTNNLAVTNILDQLNLASEQLVRWLPGFNTYGLFLASNDQAKQAQNQHYQIRLRKKESGSIEQFYKPEYRAGAKAYFLEQFKQLYKKTETELTVCQAFIHRQLLLKQSLLHRAIQFVNEFHVFQKTVVQSYGRVDAMNDLLSENHAAALVLGNDLRKLKELRAEWLLYKTSELKWLRLFAWLPFVKPILSDHVEVFAERHRNFFSDEIVCIRAIEKNLEVHKASLTEQCQKLEEDRLALQSAKAKYTQLLNEQRLLEEQLGFSLSTQNLFDFSDSNHVLGQLDRTLRYELFVLTTHYWEAAWLLESETMNFLPYHHEGRKKYWQIQAMLTPCCVTTLHSGPGFFQCKNTSQEFETLSDVIDLLIVDEAGQVMPAIAGALISVAKNILLVGDVKQIEPIASITESIDVANLKKLGLCANQESYECLKDTGILCASDSSTGHAYGNLVIVGQRKSKFHLQGEKAPGLLLKEHRRCAKEIISYCNELCYDNQLIPMTREEPSEYPRMGYAHIKGREEKVGGSRSNSQEAESIAAWVKENKTKILTICNAGRQPDDQLSLSDCLGIVTPFVAQARVIKSALSRHQLIVEKVGTIHALQGAERPIVIFSSVYTAQEGQDTFFFDQSSNMLNVAVSRAKRSFLVFGDMDIFHASDKNKPSSLLAKYLFAQESNEIVDVISYSQSKMNSESIRQITSLEGHQKALQQSFLRAERELVIVSPFLRLHAISTDKIPALIKEHAQRIVMTIYTDPGLNQGHWEEFKHAKAMLETAGAQVILANNVHSKIITIDDGLIIQGSFNWLSASRSDQYGREETSIVYKGEHVARFIEEAMEPIRRKAKDVSLQQYKEGVAS